MPGISFDFCDRAEAVASRLKEGYSWWQPGKRFNEKAHEPQHGSTMISYSVPTECLKNF